MLIEIYEKINIYLDNNFSPKIHHLVFHFRLFLILNTNMKSSFLEIIISYNIKKDHGKLFKKTRESVQTILQSILYLFGTCIKEHCDIFEVILLRRPSKI